MSSRSERNAVTSLQTQAQPWPGESAAKLLTKDEAHQRRARRAENTRETDIWYRCSCSDDVAWNYNQPSLWRCPLCAVYSIGKDAYWDCQYRTFEACYPNVIAGNRGFCNLNPWPGPSQVVPYKLRKRHEQY